MIQRICKTCEHEYNRDYRQLQKAIHVAQKKWGPDAYIQFMRQDAHVLDFWKNFKVCSKCRELKPKTPEFFYRHNDGLANWCIDCLKNYYQHNKEKCSARSHKYNESHKKEISANKKKYHIANKDKICAKTLKWSKSHPEQCREYARNYTKTPTGLYRHLSNGRRKHLVKISLDEFVTWYKEQPQVCYYCDIPATCLPYVPLCAKFTTRLSIDKLNPKGYYEAGNLALCCYGCNTMKSNLLTPKTARMAAQLDIKPEWQKCVSIIIDLQTMRLWL